MSPSSPAKRSALAVAVLVLAAPSVAALDLGSLLRPAPDGDAAPPLVVEAAAASSGPCAEPGCQAWLARHNGEGAKEEHVVAAAASPDGARAFLAGWAYGWPTTEVSIEALDVATGASLWNATHRTGGDDDRPAAAAVSPDGATLYVAGWSRGGPTGYDFLTLAYDAATGALRWSARHDGPAGSDDHARALAVSPDGATVFVAGDAWSNLAEREAVVIAYDATTGAPRWAATHDGAAGDDLPTAVATDGAAVYVTGSTENATGGDDVLALALDAATGAALWSAPYAGAGLGDDKGSSLAVGATLLIGGWTWNASAPRYDFLALSLDKATGAVQWATRVNGQGNNDDFVRALALAPDGSRAYATGESWTSTAHDYLTVALDAATGAVAWSARHNGANGWDYARAVVATADAVVVAGEVYAGAAAQDEIGTVAYDAATGAQLWSARAGLPGARQDGATALVLAGGRVVAAGDGHDAATSWDFLSAAYDVATGAEAWRSRHNAPGANDERATDVETSPAGDRVFVAGWGEVPGQGRDYLALAYDAATGGRLWAARHSGLGSTDQATALVVSPDGARVFVTGQSWGGATGWDYATVAFDAATGATLWSARFNGPANSTEEAFEIGIDPAGARVFVTGWSWTNGTARFDAATVAYDAATGAQLWSARANGPGNGHDAGRALAVAPDGSAVFVTGESPGSGTGQDVLTLAYDAATGAPLWSARFNGAGASDDQPRAVLASGGTVHVAGWTTQAGGYDFLALAYDAATGAQAWSARHNGGSTDQALAATLSPDGATLYLAGDSHAPASWYDVLAVALSAEDGSFRWSRRITGPAANADSPTAIVADAERVYVAGRSWAPSTGHDFLTAALDAATGAPAWAARYSGPGTGDDVARAAALSPDGWRLYVAGESLGAGTSYDFATIAYGAFLAPGAPRALAATAGPGAGEVTLSWDAPATTGGRALLGYRVYRDGALVAETGPAPTALVDSGLEDGATHAYAVAAFHAVGEGPRSDEAAATTFALPGAPSAVAATAGPAPGEVSLSWEAPASDGGTAVLGYRVYRDGALVAELPASEKGLVDGDLAPATTFAYEVAAVNLVGEGAPAAASATTFAVPGAPRDLAATPGDLGQIDLAWAPPASDGGSPVLGYRVYRLDGEAWTLVAATAAASFTDEGRTPLAAQRYRVAAFNAQGEGAASAEACGMPGPWVDDPLLACVETG